MPARASSSARVSRTTSGPASVGSLADGAIGAAAGRTSSTPGRRARSTPAVPAAGREAQLAADPIADRPAELGDGALGDDPAVLDERQPPAQRLRLGHRVGGEDDARAELADDVLGDELADRHRRDRVERAGRLVHEQDLGLAHQPAGDRQLLALAGRQVAERPVEVLARCRVARRGRRSGRGDAPSAGAGGRRRTRGSGGRSGASRTTARRR